MPVSVCEIEGATYKATMRATKFLTKLKQEY